MNELTVNFNRENINVNSGNAWFSIYSENYYRDFKITGMLSGECNTSYNMVHYRNESMIFYKGLGYPFNGECYFITKDSCIYNLTFKNGCLLSVIRLRKEIRMGYFRFPFFDKINHNKMEILNNSFTIYSNDNEELFTISNEDNCLKIKYKDYSRDVQINANLKDYYLSVDFDNDDECLKIDGFKYYFDGFFSYCSPISLLKIEKEKMGYKEMKLPDRMIKYISIDDIKLVENIIEELENDPDNN